MCWFVRVFVYCTDIVDVLRQDKGNVKMMFDDNGMNNQIEEDERYALLNDKRFIECLQCEVKFLKDSDMSLLIDPQEIYENDDGLGWNDSMAYLNYNQDPKCLSKNTPICSTKNKPLLKCGFIITGRPKKVWAIRFPNATIESDDCNNKWFQIGTDMMLTTYNVLNKYRCKVQSAQQYGIRHFSEIENVKAVDTVVASTKNVNQLETNDREGEITTNTTMTEDGENCCSGDRCGMIESETKFIIRKNIRHKCCVCKGAMHGGICGAEATTIMINSRCDQNDVICFVCIDKETKSNCKYMYEMN